MARKTNTAINGSEYYRITATVGRDSDGKLIRKQFYGAGKKEAEAKRDEYLNNIKNGLNVNYKDMILGKLMHTWLFEVEKVKVKPSSFEKYEGIFRNYIKSSELHGQRLSELKPIQIQRVYNELSKNGKSSSSIKSLNKLLKTFLNYAVDEGYLLRNPCIGGKIVIPDEQDAEDHDVEIFNDDEIKVLKKALEGHRLKCLVLTALGTGLRQGELLALTWEDIDLDHLEIDVNKSIKRVKIINEDGSTSHEIITQSPKTKYSNRVVPIPSNLIPILKEHETKQKVDKVKAGPSYIDDNLVFATGIGKPISVKNLFNSYKRLLIKAGIPHKKFHALRHTYATKLFEKEVPLKTVSILLGHSDISITANIYTHVMPKEKINAVEKLNDLFA